jgi:hypothetical protein
VFIQAILIFALGGIVGAILEKTYPTRPPMFHPSVFSSLPAVHTAVAAVRARKKAGRIELNDANSQIPQD